MALPKQNITPIPNNEPDAVPSVWNTRYVEIDQNFANIDGRLAAREGEMDTARGGKASLGARLDQMGSDIAGTSIEMQNAQMSGVKYALELAGLAHLGLRALRDHAQQQGEFTMQNAGVVSGCTITKSGTAARNLNLTGGACFANGRSYAVADSVNTASVPVNSGAGSVTAYAYLYQDANGLWRLTVTPIGQAVPAGGIALATLTIPAASTDITDPNLVNVTLTDTRRIEADFPQVLNSPVSYSPVLRTLAANDYHLEFDIIAATGAACSERNLVVTSRATNGFTVLLASAADNVTVRWKASKLNQ